MSKYTFFLIGIFLLLACGKESTEGKKIFRYNSESGISSLDPAFAGNLPNVRAVTQLFNGLVELDSTLQVKPAIAHAWEVSEDLKTYTFKLRNDVFFHNHSLFPNGKGRKVVASDFVYSFNRICDTTGLFNQGIWIFKEIVLKNALGQISDTCFVAENDSTFKLYLNQPAPHLLQILTMPYAYVVPREVTEVLGLDFRAMPVGTGPFRFGEWEEGEALILYKNETYWKKDGVGKPLPYLDAVEVSFIPDKSQAFRSFMLGKLDYITSVEESFIDEVLYSDGGVKESFTNRYDVQKEAYFNTEFLGIQLNEQAEAYKNEKGKHPLLNKNFRKALSFAVDRKKLINYLRNSLGYPGEHGFIPPPTPYVDAQTIRGFSFNPDSARHYLKLSGLEVEKLPRLEITVVKEYEALVDFLAKTWLDVLGVRVEADIKDAKVGRVLINAGKTKFFKQSWLGDYPEAGNYMSLLYSGNFTPYGPNKMHYANAQCDSLYRKAQVTLHEEERAALYAKMDEIATEEVPLIILFYDEMLQLSQKNIVGLKANAMSLLILETVDKHLE